ncbi:Helicase protein MOM1 [Quillaja saponaria]|uniref:Helicase protein MOM1 n=1 Tax=Quillaja saponaria TaxID=32244 RepID=A0AAD7Q052_QUISA|nr:Helicase protein MOM1 [Quillaja saponaria]
MELGLHSVSEVESVWDASEGILVNEVMQRQKQYLMKYQALAHAHNLWISERQLLLEAPRPLAKFNRKFQSIRWKREWNVPQRLLLKSKIVLPKQNEECIDGHGNETSSCHYQWLIKWTALGYGHATWELDDASFMTSPEGKKLIKDYESCHQRTDRLQNTSKADKD